MKVEWVEPNERGEAVVRQLSCDDAVRLMRSTAARTGHVYRGDDEALTDFIVINWARLVEDK